MTPKGNKMTPEEANKIVALYMGVEICQCCENGWDGKSRSIHNYCHTCGKPHMNYQYGKYKENVEECIPVLEKLGINLDIQYRPKMQGFSVRRLRPMRAYGTYKHPSEALVVALANIIQKEKNDTRRSE